MAGHVRRTVTASRIVICDNDGMTTEQPTITVRKYAHVVPTDAIGVDEQGRTLVRCPVPGCSAF